MTAPSGRHRDSTGRFEQRYWNRATWTDHVCSNGKRSMDLASAIMTTRTFNLLDGSHAVATTCAPPDYVKALEDASAGSEAFSSKGGPEVKDSPKHTTTSTAANRQ